MSSVRVKLKSWSISIIPRQKAVETAAHLRAMPNLHFWRPADLNETSAAYLVAIKAEHTPSVLALSRQNLRMFAFPSCSFPGI